METKTEEREDDNAMDKDDMKMFAVFFAFIVLVVLTVTLPIAWCSGHANQIYLRHVHGIEMPWYYAAFVETTEQPK
jgi:hypothetical protein